MREKYNKVRNRGVSGVNGGMGMHKHAISGRSYNKALSIERVRELNKKHTEERARLQRIHDREWKATVKEVFNS